MSRGIDAKRAEMLDQEKVSHTASVQKRIIGIVLFAIIVLAIWEVAYLLGVHALQVWKPYAVPSPLGVAKSLFRLCASGSLIRAILNSLLRGVIGYAIAVLIGGIIGVLMNQISYLNRYLKPFVSGVQTLPSICWVPFSILWFGLSQQAIIFVVVMGSAFSISIAVDRAIEQVPVIYKKAAMTMGASRRQLYFKVILPASVPALITGLKQGWSFAWRALMSGEVMTTCVGLGQTLITGRDMADIDQVMLVMIVIVVVGIAIDKLVFATLERKLSYKL